MVIALLTTMAVIMAMAALVAQPVPHLVDMTLQVVNVEVWEHGRELALTLVLAKLGQGHMPGPIAKSGPGAIEPHARLAVVASSAEAELHSFRLVASA